MSQSKDQPNQTTPKHKLDTADFLAFSDSQPTEFCPTNSSSPQKFWKQTTPRNNYRNNRNNQRFSGNYQNTSFNSPESRQNRSFSGPYEPRRFDSPNYSFNSSYNNSRSSFNSSNDNSRSRNNRSFNSNRKKDQGITAIESYLHPSFMEDPWAKLEKQMSCLVNTSIDSEVINDLSLHSDSNISIETFM